MSKFWLIGLILGVLSGLVACKPVDVDAGAATTTFAANLTDISNYAVSKGISGSTTASGLYFALTKASTASTVAAYQTELEFTFKLYALSGPSNSTVTGTNTSTVVTDKVVDTTYAVNPTFVPFFQGVLKAGLEEGLLKLHEGESAILLVPSRLAFGNVVYSDGLIPANSPVRYDVTLRRSRTETQRMDEYAITTGLSFTTIASGTYQGIRVSKTTASPTTELVADALTAGKSVAIKYVGQQLYAGTAIDFDNTGTSNVQYNSVNFVSGFNAIISTMRVGESATILLPSAFGYGSLGLVMGESNKTYKIPPYTPLRYDITVVSAK